MADFLGMSTRSSKKSARVYVEAPDTSSQPVLAPQLATKQQRRAIATVTRHLSHDISTEQLFTDQLIDGKVADDDESEDDDQENGENNKRIDAAPQKPELYRIESHSALSSLEQRPDTHSSSPLAGARPTAKPHKLAPLNGSPNKPHVILTGANVACSKCRESIEMPPAHCAAFSGHLQCLEALLKQELPCDGWFDKKRRTPLFYACAANKLGCVDSLLSAHPDWLKIADKQLDAPVHVCCFFGWSECLEKLLGAGADPHVRNAKGFKPSHIAKNEQCLELLLSFGDDLLQGDKLGRTPLFVACARDRSTCVEFLCAWNLRSQSWMLEQEDQRGDRPIHAAACNGSASSLEILLRYGADPVAVNAKGLSPKDLAATNHHDKCVELLTRAEEEQRSSSSAWFAPANAAGEGEWLECWDKDSGQPFYYNNLTGKCQWEMPDAPFTPHQHTQQNLQQQQDENEEEDDDGGEYVWVKKKKQAVAVVTGKDTEWIAVQDPASRAIYYKNTRTGQTQWEEPDAIRQLQSAVGAKASQEASRIWEELDHSRSALAIALAKEKRRQLAAHKQTLEACRLQIKQRKEDILKREEQARLAQLLPRSSFIRRKKQSMMMKVSTHNSKARTDLGNEHQPIAEVTSCEDRIDDICSREPALDIFLSTYLKLQGVQNLQVLTPEKRIANCLYHYYVALVDPVQMKGMSKSQFRSVLRDALIIPSSSAGNASSASYLSLTPGGLSGNPPLKLHVIDLIFSQAERAMTLEATSSFILPPSSPSGHSSLLHHRQAAATAITPGGEAHLNVGGFITAIQIVRERVVTQVEQQENESEIEDDEEWFVLTFLVPLALKLGARLLTQIRQCKELELQVSASTRIQEILSSNRLTIQSLHRHYSALEPTLKMLTFRGLARFVLDFGVLPTNALPSLHFLLESVHWTSGNAHTEIISFEKFQQVLAALASLPIADSGTAARAAVVTITEEKIVNDFTNLLGRLSTSPAFHLVGTQMLPSSSSNVHPQGP